MKLLEPGAPREAAPPLTPEELARLIAAGQAPAAVTIAPDADVQALAPLLGNLSSITVPFAAFRDGRGFSTAAQLREAGFTGELRATGDLLADQARMLARCGFDLVELPDGAQAGEWRRALSLVKDAYQPAEDAVTPIPLRRLARPDISRAGAQVTPLRPLVPSTARTVQRLNEALRDATAEEILRVALHEAFPGKVAVLSSFGAEAAVSLHLVSQADPATPVLFLDTDRHFAPTLTYRDQLVQRLGLTDVRNLRPAEADTRRHDARGDLWRIDNDLCCEIRKVRPLAEATPGFSALITGRKRFHGAERMRLPVFEEVDGQVRINPLANWSQQQVDAYFTVHDLPRHPLTDGGFSSIGCWPCTQQSSEEDVRSGRWAGAGKRECGIHLPSRWAAELDRAS